MNSHLASIMPSFIVTYLRNSPANPCNCRLESEHNEPQSPSSRLVQRFFSVGQEHGIEKLFPVHPAACPKLYCFTAWRHFLRRAGKCLCLMGLILSVVFPQVSVAETTWRSIELHHRSASELIRRLQPLLTDDIRLATDGNRLLVAAPEGLAEDMAHLIAGMDRPLPCYDVVLWRRSSSCGGIKPDAQEQDRINSIRCYSSGSPPGFKSRIRLDADEEAMVLFEPQNQHYALETYGSYVLMRSVSRMAPYWRISLQPAGEEQVRLMIQQWRGADTHELDVNPSLQSEESFATRLTIPLRSWEVLTESMPDYAIESARGGHHYSSESNREYQWLIRVENTCPAQ